jgi:hypothetical protein
MRIAVIGQTDLLTYLCKFKSTDRFEIHVVGSQLLIYAPGKVSHGVLNTSEPGKNPYGHIPDCNWSMEARAKCPACHWEESVTKEQSFEQMLSEKDANWLKEIKITI